MAMLVNGIKASNVEQIILSFDLKYTMSLSDFVFSLIKISPHYIHSDLVVSTRRIYFLLLKYEDYLYLKYMFLEQMLKSLEEDTLYNKINKYTI